MAQCKSSQSSIVWPLWRPCKHFDIHLEPTSERFGQLTPVKSKLRFATASQESADIIQRFLFTLMNLHSVPACKIALKFAQNYSTIVSDSG
jgi:hypothetical protein